MSTIALVASLLAPAAASNSGGDPSRVADRLARYLGVPRATLDVQNRSRIHLPLTGVRATVFKVAVGDPNTTRSIAITSSGRIADPETLLAAERSASFRRFGKLDPRLYERVAAARPGQRFRVILWLHVPAITPRQADVQATGTTGAGSIDVADVHRDWARADAMMSSAVARAASPARHALRRFGVGSMAIEGVPAIAASLTAHQVTAMSRIPGIETIYLSSRAKSSSAIVHSTAGFKVTDNRGITGSGVDLAQVEVGGGVNTNNPYLQGYIVSDSSATMKTSAHSAIVAGIIRYHASSALNLATGDATGRTAYLFDRTKAAMTWGAAAVNHSWGEICRDKYGNLTGNLDGQHGDLDKTMDGFVYTDRRLQVVAAGNDGDDASCLYVGEPGGAWNALTVGNFDDRNTNTWTDDVMAYDSSWKDPYSYHGDMDKPEVAGPGTNIDSAMNSSPWWTTNSTWSGTSFAAPVYTALAGDLVQRDTALASRPEALKAILMVSSIHNVEGQARLSEYDGVGGPWAGYADDVAKGIYVGTTGYKKSWWYSRQYSCATVPKNINYYAYWEGGKRARAAIAWSTSPSYEYYRYQPSADLDLRVYDYATGTLLRSSTSYDNGWEIVDFTPSNTGFYTLQVRNVRCDVSPAALGVAWWQAP